MERLRYKYTEKRNILLAEYEVINERLAKLTSEINTLNEIIYDLNKINEKEETE